jgi:methionyl-tRNA formyltransferase
MTRVVFMGTPEFSVPSLQALLAGPYNVVGVVTQPDRPRGRGRKPVSSPVKQISLERGLEVFQPRSLRQPEAIADLAGLEPDVIVVAAFGQILLPEVLVLPTRGCLNVHASLLPRWRGAAPVQAAILAGDQVTGSTIMLMDEGMDTGPVLAQAALGIDAEDTGGTLSQRLSLQGADLLAETLPRWLAGEIEPWPQDDRWATLCRPLRKDQGRIDWSRPAPEIARAVRAYNPWPAASTTWRGQSLKILRAVCLVGDAVGQRPGTVLERPEPGAVVTGDGLLGLQVVQLAGRRAMPIADFLRGQRDLIGSRLGLPSQ